MSGLLALLDDVAAIAKLAATSVDDVMGQAAKAGSKAAGAVIDDAAVTPKYLRGFAPARELPLVWRIAKGSLRNKLLFLLPAALALSEFAPWAIMPLLMLGGAYLCFEGAEKVLHAMGAHPPQHEKNRPADPAHLEEARAQGAIKTDFILSAEIMTIALAALPPSDLVTTAATLAAVAVGITGVVYGGVALIVKADDVGLWLAEEGATARARRLGAGIVRVMPRFLSGLTVIGTAAMLWVGGEIVLHGLEDLGWGWPLHEIERIAHDAAENAQGGPGLVAWAVEAGMAGLLGLALGRALVPLAEGVLVPAYERLAGRSAA